MTTEPAPTTHPFPKCTPLRRIANAEQRVASIINGIKDIEYVSSDFGSKAIASNFFGIEEQNFETYFFTIDFLALEKIDCPEC